MRVSGESPARWPQRAGSGLRRAVHLDNVRAAHPVRCGICPTWGGDPLASGCGNSRTAAKNPPALNSTAANQGPGEVPGGVKRLEVELVLAMGWP